MTMGKRDELSSALRAARPGPAVRHAGALAREGRWDNVVAATLYLLGRPGSPEQERAAVWLEGMIGAAEVHRAPTSQAAWAGLMTSLIQADRWAEAAEGLELASAARLIGPHVWHAAARASYAMGRSDEAEGLLQAAVVRHPDDGAIWSSLALLQLERGELEAAGAACVRALAQAPHAPGPLLSAALIFAGAGNRAAARDLLAQARRRGAPETTVEGFLHLVG